jgi:hypothetical protein
MRVALTLALSWLVAGVNTAAGDPAPRARLSGTFIQLLEQHGRWDDAQWDELFQTLNSIGIRELIVQWSVLDGAAYYSSRAFRPVANAPLEKLLAQADRFGMSVLTGLAHDSDYWSNIQAGPEAAAAFLAKLRSRSIRAANELSPIVKRHPSFHGWYIPEEVDDINWRLPEARNILIEHLSALAKELRRLAPQETLAVSAFSQAQSSPQAYQQFWEEMLRAAPVTAVFFQDGVGVNKLELDELPLYLRALRAAADNNGRLVQVVVELFRQTGGPPIDNSVFRAVPGSPDRIRAQLRLAAEYSTGGIIGFSVPEYMSPLGGAAAGELLAQ